MTSCLKFRLLAAAFAGLVLAAVSGRAFGHIEMLVGQNAAGQIKVHFHQHDPLRMPLSVIPNVQGWNGSGPGIESLGKDEPKEDFFVLPSTAEIEVMLFSIDPTLHLFNENGSGFVPVGGTYVVLIPFFHWHCFWNLFPGEYGTVYHAQLQFFDKSGQLTASDPVTIDFTPQCPGDVDLSTFVDVNDLLDLISTWGPCPNDCAGTCAADFDATCTVDVNDLLTVIASWGECVR